MTLRCRWSVAAVTSLAAVVTAVAQSPAEGPSALANQLRAYLTAYEVSLGEVVATERMTQRSGPHILSDGETSTSGAPRVLESDVAFVALPGGAGWLGYRDVLRRNGRALRRTGPPLSALLAVDRTESQDRARALLIASAAHNLGAPRTINLPTLPLEFLHARNMHRLTLTAATPQPEGQGECRGHRLEFRETSLPTLIQRRRAATCRAASSRGWSRAPGASAKVRCGRVMREAVMIPSKPSCGSSSSQMPRSASRCRSAWRKSSSCRRLDGAPARPAIRTTGGSARQAGWFRRVDSVAARPPGGRLFRPCRRG
jgi:hypothetical protein